MVKLENIRPGILYRDREFTFLDGGNDSLVYLENNREVLKIYPSISPEGLMIYRGIMNEIGEGMGCEEVASGDGWSVEIGTARWGDQFFVDYGGAIVTASLQEYVDGAQVSEINYIHELSRFVFLDGYVDDQERKRVVAILIEISKVNDLKALFNEVLERVESNIYEGYRRKGIKLLPMNVKLKSLEDGVLRLVITDIASNVDELVGEKW